MSLKDTNREEPYGPGYGFTEGSGGTHWLAREPSAEWKGFAAGRGPDREDARIMAERGGPASEIRLRARWIHSPEEHEERAEAFVWSAGITLAFSVAVLVLGPGQVGVAALVTALAAAVTLALGYRVGHSGGELVFKHGAAAAYTGGDAAGAGEAGGVADHEPDDD